MAYIPPHKRHSKDPEKPTPIKESLASSFKKNVKLRAPNPVTVRIYSNFAIRTWLAVGFDQGDENPSAAHLKPVTVESIQKKSFVLIKQNLVKDIDNTEATQSPWSSIVAKVLPDLLSCFQKERMEASNDVKPSLVARFGKILFHDQSPYVNLESEPHCVTETKLIQMKKTFYTTVPDTYAANIMAEIPSKIGLNFFEVKDSYHVKLSDQTRPSSIISCKCRATKDRKLQLYKVELHPVKDMIIDISCLDMELDLRLALYHKKILTSLSDDEMQNLRNLIEAAVVDQDVKGGLRWPFGKASTGKYSVVVVWHIAATTYQNASIRLKIKHADRFDFKTSLGQTSKEVVLNFKGIVSKLLVSALNFQEQAADDTNAISDMLKDNLSLIWQHFLFCEPFLA